MTDDKVKSSFTAEERRLFGRDVLEQAALMVARTAGKLEKAGNSFSLFHFT